ncbi:MAG: DUF6494 family protein [Geminicoccaceae bacterium]
MNEDTLNMSLRKFLKTVGVTSQRAIEQAVRDAVAEGRVADDARLPAKVTLRVEGIDLELDIHGELMLG